MNLLDLLCVAFLLLCAFLGLYQGFLRSCAQGGAYVCGLLGASLFWKIVAKGFIRGGQLIPILLNFSESDEFLMGQGENYGDRLMAAITNIRTPVSSLGPDFLEKLEPTLHQGIPHPLGSLLEENIAGAAFAGEAGMLGEYLSLTVAYFATAVLSFLLVFALCTVIFSFLAALADNIIRFPQLARMDSLAGAAVGLVNGWILLMAIGLLIPVVLSFVSVPFLQEIIEGSSFAGMIYEGNALLKLFRGFVG